MPSHYEVLGVSPTATDAEIRTKFHSIAKQYHPDVTVTDSDGQHPPSHAAQTFFEDAQAAYNAIKTPELRAAYDAKLALLTPRCKRCEGDGTWQERRGWGLKQIVCPDCGGTGKER